MNGDPRTMTLIELIDAFGIECSNGGAGMADESGLLYAEIKRRVEAIDRRMDEYRGAKNLRDGIRTEVEGSRVGWHVEGCTCLVSEGAVLNVDVRCDTP